MRFSLTGEGFSRSLRFSVPAAALGFFTGAVEGLVLPGGGKGGSLRVGQGRHHAATLPAAVLTQHRGRIGRQGQQVLDGVAGPVQGLGLDGFRDVEQHHDHGGFRELPDEHGPGDGHGHEGIDVQVEVGDGQPALAVGGQTVERCEKWEQMYYRLFIVYGQETEKQQNCQKLLRS